MNLLEKLEDLAEVAVDAVFVDLTDMDGVRHSIRRDKPPTHVRHHPKKNVVHLTFEDGLTLQVATSWASLRVHFRLPFDLPLPDVHVPLPSGGKEPKGGGGRKRAGPPEVGEPATEG